MKFTRVEPGHYTSGPYTLRGIARRGDGRTGSRVNHWLIYADGELRTEATTLEWAKVAAESLALAAARMTRATEVK